MGLLQEGNPLITSPPFRSVHHTTTKSSLVGGGRIPRIGEITLAHKGVLYLDELPEFSRTVIEVLRQPLEDKGIQITRTVGSYYFPADFILVCAMNPCPCGMYPDLEKCTCSPSQISGYLGKISQPFLDRIDICLEVPRLKYTDLKNGGREEVKRDGNEYIESSSTVRERVITTRKRQLASRQGDSINSLNANLSPKEVQKYCVLDKEGEELMEQAYHRLNLTARSYHKVLKVARTIADMDESEYIQPKHLREGIAYRTLDKKYWR
jgi:magnesium chelatase family protein